MNAIVSFGLCKLTNEELAKKVDALTDELYQSGKIPTRHIPARPDQDFDLLVGELCRRTLESPQCEHPLSVGLPNVDDAASPLSPDTWTLLSSRMPVELETVWLCNPKTGTVSLGCWAWHDEDAWCWAYSNGIIYSENGRIVSECEYDDERDFTHWKSLPMLPDFPLSSVPA